MLIKVVGQLLLAVVMLRAAPLDAAYLEESVLEKPFTASYLNTVNIRAYLPTAEQRKVLPPKKKDLESFGVLTSAESVVVIDEASGATLYAEAPDVLRPMGSITKLMTALVFLDTQPDLGREVALIEDDYIFGGRMYLRFNDSISLKELLGASLVGSDNVATQALVRLSGLSTEDFLAAMNNKADELGMSQTLFVDATGISSFNTSTARELALLLYEAKRNSLIKDFMTKSSFTVTQNSGISVDIPSTDMLLQSELNNGDFKISGGKTGYIPEAGYCLATAVEYDGQGIIVVVLGASEPEERFSDVINLTHWIFKTFVWPRP